MAGFVIKKVGCFPVPKYTIFNYGVDSVAALNGIHYGGLWCYLGVDRTLC